MLAHHWVILFEGQFFGVLARIFLAHIEEARLSGAYQLNQYCIFLSHSVYPSVFATCARHCINHERVNIAILNPKSSRTYTISQLSFDLCAVSGYECPLSGI